MSKWSLTKTACDKPTGERQNVLLGAGSSTNINITKFEQQRSAENKHN